MVQLEIRDLQVTVVLPGQMVWPVPLDALEQQGHLVNVVVLVILEQLDQSVEQESRVNLAQSDRPDFPGTPDTPDFVEPPGTLDSRDSLDLVA